MKKGNIKNTELGCINQNGIYIDGDILLDSERKFSPKYYLIIQIILAFVSVISTVSMASSFVFGGENKSSEIRLSVMIFYALAAVLMFGLLKCRNKKIKYASAAFSALHTAYLIFNFSAVKTGFFVAVDNYLVRANQPNSVWGSYLRSIPETDYSYYTEMFFIALTSLLAITTAASCIYRIDFPLLFITTFPFIELGLYWGWEAPPVCVLALVICWITILALHIINHTTNKAGKNNTFAVHERKKTFYFTSEKEKSKFYSIYIRFICILCAAVFLAIIIFSLITGFTRPDSFEKYRKNISKAVSNFSLSDLEKSLSDYDEVLDLFGVKTVGGTNGGVLGTTKSISFNGSTSLKVKTQAFNKAMYLRGYVAGVYSDNCWTPVDADEKDVKFDDYFSDANLWVQDMNYAIMQNCYREIQPQKISIDVKGASKKFAYAPYGALYTSDINSSGMKPTLESYVKLGDSSYSMYYYNLDVGTSWIDIQKDIIDRQWQETENNINNKSEKALKAIDDYQQFVYKNYSEIADSKALKKAYDDIINYYMPDYDKDYNNFDQVYEAIRKYFSDNFSYTLEPGVTPKGEDFIEYFLTVQKKGYCSYFATAGTELLRMFGFPARYTEGYMILPSQLGADSGDDPDKTYEINVKDKCAHAWAEVYIDEVGWIPAEFTPGYNNNNTNLSDEEKNIQTATSSSTQTKTATNAPDKTAVSGNSSAVISKNTSKPSSSDKSSSGNVSKKVTKASSPKVSAKNDNKNSAKKISGVFAGIILIVGGLAVIITGIILRRCIKLNEMKKKCFKGSENQRIKQILSFTLKYLKLIDIDSNLNVSDMQLCKILIQKCHEKNINDLDNRLYYLFETTVKAQMSNNKIKPEELNQAYKIMEYIASKTVLPRLTAIGKLAGMFIYCLY